MNEFRKAIQTALENPNLQQALDANAERRLQARLRAFASLPGGQAALRSRAHQLRGETIRHLDEYLAQFIEQAQANGLIIHRAPDAAAAAQAVLRIARRHRARLIAKSKSMVSEEIGLNQALAAAGIEAVETDLGEYIVQLRHEPPAHILTPAVHLTRRDVGALFAEKLGMAYTEDIPTLIAAARQVLRQTFLQADIGITGVNLGVAESGTLCLVTNEGNGRMVTTLPRVHISLMGIERLVPRLDDLALILALLPRSASGIKLSAYVSLIHGPAAAGCEGPQERHLVLVDNGRSRLRHSPLAEALSCIRCGTCLNVCPVFREIGGHAYRSLDGRISPYPGPIGSVISPGLFGLEAFGHLARACTLCGACKEACPVAIDLPEMIRQVRVGEIAPQNEANDSLSMPGTGARDQAGSGGKPHVPWRLRLFLGMFGWIARSPRRYRWAQRALGRVSRFLVDPDGFMRLPAFTGWGAGRDFPRFADRPFRERFAGLKPEETDHAPAREPTVTQPAASPPQAAAPAAQPLALDERFAAELRAFGGEVVHCKLENLAEAIVQRLQADGIDRLQTWEAGHLPVGLLVALHRAGITLVQHMDADLRAGLTGALAGIAETGSLALHSGPGRPSTASLLPEMHLAVLPRAAIVENLAQALALPALRQNGAAVLVTGPSRTADIEMTLTVGMHGPKQVVVFLV